MEISANEDAFFKWFCGGNTTDENLISHFAWDLDHTLYNACFTDFLYAVPHLLFIILAVLVLLALGCFTNIRKTKYTYLVQYPLHNLRWIIYFILFSISLCEIGESVLTDVDVYNDSSTMPHLYIPAILTFVATVLTLIYYNQMELWGKPHMSWLLLLYWVTGLCGETVRIINLYYDEDVDITLLRYDISIAALVVYTILLMIELNVIRIKIFKCCSEEELFPNDLKKDDMRFLQGYTSFFSSVFYWWVNWVYIKGYNNTLELSDLGSLGEVHTTKYQRESFTKALKKEQERAKANNKPLSLYRAYARAFGYRVMIGGFAKFVGDVCTFVPPLALAGAIDYVTNIYYSGGLEDYGQTKYISASDFLRNGFVLVIIMFWVTILKLMSQQGHYHIVITESAYIKTALQSAIYDKSLRLSSYTMTGGAMTMGQITNHMSVDTTNILNATQWVHYVWSIPFVISGYLVILYLQLGVASLIGAIVFFVSIPIQVIVARKTAQYQKLTMFKSDDRLKKTNELLQGIKLIKLYGWEDMFYTAIAKVRAAEILMMIKQMAWRLVLMTITSASPLLVTIVSYSLYTTLTGSPLTPEIAFTSLSVFNQLTTPLFIMPQVFVYNINAMVSTTRLRGFFEAPEVEKYAEDKSSTEDESGIYSSNASSNSEVAIAKPKKKKFETEDKQRLLFDNGRLSDSSNKYGTFDRTTVPDGVTVRIKGDYTWDVESKNPTLKNINLDIPAGKLTMVVGQVGSGKSSLLSAILGEMTTVSGAVQWGKNIKTVAYGAQKAWLLNASLKDNVLFGQELDEERYKKVIAACSLQPDIDILPGGDQTEIGEKGINLSGGQKQRVSVARAMYSYSKVVILDDPLSALDMHVGSHLFKKGIEGFLMKKSKRTVILVTHQIQYAEKADQIVYMNNGSIVHQGTLDDIHDANPDLVAAWSATATMVTLSESEFSGSEVADTVEEERAKLQRQVSLHLKEKDVLPVGGKDQTISPAGQLVQKETKAEGSVSWSVYYIYLKALGIGLFIGMLILIVIQNGLSIWTNFWLSDWSEAGAAMTNATEKELLDSLKYYLGGYAGLSVVSIIAGAISSGMISIAALYAAKKLHNSMLANVLHAPLRFFDITPIGRILNRFSSDTSVIDQRLGSSLSFFLRFSGSCISAVIVNIIVTWYFVIALIPVFILYILLMKVFIRTSRELQRIESVTKSPVYAHFSESLGGLPTLRAYKQQHRFQQAIIKKIECNNIAFIYLNTSNRWLATRLDMIGAIVVLLAGLITMVTALSGTLAPSLVGLSISYALSISSQLNWVVRTSADMEMQMNAVERVDEYKSIETEEREGTLKPAPNWPDKGDIVFRNVSARYASDLDPVIQNVSIHFKSGEKIGICGRTGSGKSSLTLTLFRIIQTFKGQIFIDDVNIAHLPLVEVRHRLAIIPQDPVLFTGTIRFNLDGDNEHSDDELWEALEIAQLKDVVSELDLKLDALVTEGGENFSVGQRQLFCLARAFLRKTRILVMDEATASIDLETDAILQEVVATAFKDRTVLTIAHRVQTIMDSDHILVLSDGKIAEYDTPENLLANEDGIFTSLVKAGT